MVYLDTSVLAAYYCPEALSAKVEKAILRAELPAISALVEVEFVSAIGRKVRENTLSRPDAERMVSQLRVHMAAGHYERLPIESSSYEVARDWLGQFAVPLRTLDALHLAVCFVHSADLLTADAGLAKAARHFRVRTELLAPP